MLQAFFPPPFLYSLQRAYKSNLCLTQWQLFDFFFLFFSPAEVCSAGFGNVFTPRALTSFKIRAVFIFPRDRNSSFFSLFTLTFIPSWESTRSTSSFITSTWIHNGPHLPLDRNQAVPILTLTSTLFIVCDLWSGPDTPGCLRWLTFLTISRYNIL